MYKFKIKDDRLISMGCYRGISGNVNSYLCEFDIACDYPALDWFATFKKDNEEYFAPIIDGKCVIPHNVLSLSGTLLMGAYGTNSDPENLVRVSTNLVEIEINRGGYMESAVNESVPDMDVWEQFTNEKINNKLDKICFDAVIETVTDKVTEDIFDGTAPELEMAHNCEMRYGEITELALTIPETIPENYISSVIFTSGETETNLIYPNSIKWCGNYVLDGVFVPGKNMRYDIFFAYDGANVVAVVGGYSL